MPILLLLLTILFSSLLLLLFLFLCLACVHVLHLHEAPRPHLMNSHHILVTLIPPFFPQNALTIADTPTPQARCTVHRQPPWRRQRPSTRTSSTHTHTFPTSALLLPSPTRLLHPSPSPPLLLLPFPPPQHNTPQHHSLLPPPPLPSSPPPPTPQPPPNQPHTQHTTHKTKNHITQKNTQHFTQHHTTHFATHTTQHATPHNTRRTQHNTTQHNTTAQPQPTRHKSVVSCVPLVENPTLGAAPHVLASPPCLVLGPDRATWVNECQAPEACHILDTCFRSSRIPCAKLRSFKNTVRSVAEHDDPTCAVELVFNTCSHYTVSPCALYTGM